MTENADKSLGSEGKGVKRSLVKFAIFFLVVGLPGNLFGFAVALGQLIEFGFTLNVDKLSEGLFAALAFNVAVNFFVYHWPPTWLLPVFAFWAATHFGNGKTTNNCVEGPHNGAIEMSDSVLKSDNASN